MYRFLLLAAAVSLLFAGCDSTVTEQSLASLSDSELEIALRGLEISDLPEGASCRTAQIWVEQNPELLPTDLYEIRSMDPTFQRAVVPELSADRQALIWNQHLSEYARGLAPSRAEALSKIQRAVTPSFIARAKSLPEEERAAYMDGVMGSPDDLAETFGKEATRMFTSLDQPGAESTERRPIDDCGCSTASDWCGFGTSCGGSVCVSNPGCGTLWQYQCVGDCQG